jgi:hypothetical protein
MIRLVCAVVLIIMSVTSASAQPDHFPVNGQAMWCWSGSAWVGCPTSATGTLDPCMTQTHVYTPISIATNANTKIIAGTSAKKTYICHIFLFAAAANNVAVMEGTGTNCGSTTAGVIGGATAATGINLIANEGFTEGVGSNAIAATATATDDLCLITSTSAQTSGVVVSVQQ